MADEQIKLDLDPKKVLDALQDMGEEAKKLSTHIEESLGKDSAKSIGKLEEAAERGTNKIQGFFRNLGQRVKEDLKTAFDATGILAGAKFAKELGEGVKQVFEMERAFDKLNTRLKLTSAQLQVFKKEVGKKVSATGQKMEDILPGVETIASRGNVKSPEQLASISEALAQVKGTTGEDVSGIAESVTDILRNQGKKITAASVKEALNTIQSTRVAGAFGSAGEAAHAIEGVSALIPPSMQKKMGIGGREIGGLAAAASKAGPGGTDILSHILERATKAGGPQVLNALLGTQLFGKNGQLNTQAFSKMTTKGLGAAGGQVAAESLGTSQADLARWIDSMKNNMDDFKQVTSGANETADQFAVASDNLATGVDKFRENTKEAAREVGASMSALGKDVVKGNFGNLWKDVKEVAKAGNENKGMLASAALLTAGVGMVAGGGIGRLLSKTGMGGLAGGMVKGEAAKAAGIQPVYVTNASEIGGGGMGGGMAGMAGVGGKLGAAAGLAGSLGLGVMIGDALNSTETVQAVQDSIASMLVKAIHGSDEDIVAAGGQKGMEGYLGSKAHQESIARGNALTPEQIAKGVEMGTVAANNRAKKIYTNPSTPHGAARGF